MSAPVPTFGGRGSLSLADLDALAQHLRALGIARQPLRQTRRGVYRGSAQADVPLAQYRAGISSVDTPGRIRSIRYDSSIDAPYINNGDVFLPGTPPMAYYNYPGYIDQPGGIRSIRYDSSIDAPYINNGDVFLPGTPPMAYYNYPGYIDQPGGIRSIRYDSSIDEPVIYGGDVRLPSRLGTQYRFDYRFFVTNGDMVTLNIATLQDYLSHGWSYTPTWDW